MLWVAVVAGTPAIRRISSCTVRVGECSAAYKEASFAGSTRHDIHQVSVEYLAGIIRRIIEIVDVAVILVEPVQLSRTFTSNLADLTINSRAQLICIV